ncbi:MAG: glucosidase, partial [Planctomycetota bacterium]
MTLEDQRLEASEKRTENWHRWGPYLSERQWGTVREDYSPGGENTWGYLSHDQARSRAFRWGEDGLLGICDRQCRLCFSVALWNGNDPILKERLFGVTGPEGNHGEDVKELYYYDDSTPTHSWMRATYKYPQCEYPYAELVEENSKRGLQDPEFEIEDTKAFDDNCYFDVVATYAKATPDDILIDVTITNCGPKKASIHVLPQFFFRNTWTWQCTDEGCTARPSARDLGGVIETNHETLGKFFVACESIAPDPADDSRWVFCDNETNSKLHPDMPSEGEYYKDAFHRLIVDSEEAAINPKKYGTKFAAYHQWELAAGESRSIRLRMAASKQSWTDNSKNAAEKMHALAFNESFGATIEARKQEADDFYASRIDAGLSEERKAIMRQSYAGLLWTKQFYHYVVDTWLKGDPNGMPIADGRNDGRNSSWRHLFNREVVSMPDKWEYPWYAAWDLAFHMVPVAQIDIEFAKSQMLLFLREWYMHPSGQIPAYEWNLSDVNPPVHAWGVWQVYKATGPPEKRDKVFLARCFQKLLLNFTWWINRKDPNGRNIFAGGFLGLDNIGVFDR